MKTSPSTGGISLALICCLLGVGSYYVSRHVNTSFLENLFRFVAAGLFSLYACASYYVMMDLYGENYLRILNDWWESVPANLELHGKPPPFVFGQGSWDTFAWFARHTPNWLLLLNFCLFGTLVWFFYEPDLRWDAFRVVGFLALPAFTFSLLLLLASGIQQLIRSSILTR